MTPLQLYVQTGLPHNTGLGWYYYMGFQPSARGHCGFQASWPWTRNLQAQGTSFPIGHKSQWWFYSFSLKCMNTMTVIVKNHMGQAAVDKSSQLHTENAFAVYWQNKQIKYGYTN